jgi:menaquinone-dependent protoporphyrinogen oxidase
MNTKVLVAYASTHGSTQEVAEVIAETIRAQGLVVDLQPARAVRSLEGYSAVVLGAPLYMFHLHKDALGFLAKRQKELTGGLPIAIFAGGPIEKGEDPATWQEIRRQLDQELAKFPWLQPAAVEIFGGKFDPTTLHFPWNLIPAMRQRPPSDLRDWQAIRTWAVSLVNQFQPSTSA